MLPHQSQFFCTNETSDFAAIGKIRENEIRPLKIAELIDFKFVVAFQGEPALG